MYQCKDFAIRIDFFRKLLFPHLNNEGKELVKFAHLETDNQNLRMVPAHFSPTSGSFSTIGHLEPKLLRFQGLICRINHFCNPIGLEFIAKNVNFSFSVKSRICKKKKTFFFRFTFSDISHEPRGLQKCLIRQINHWNLSNMASRYHMALNEPEVVKKWPGSSHKFCRSVSNSLKNKKISPKVRH